VGIIGVLAGRVFGNGTGHRCPRFGGQIMADLEIHDIPERLKEGIQLVERGAIDKGRPIFEGYLQTHPDSALALSYLGMLRAVRNNQGHQGLELCQEAVRKDPREALCFLNLARVHLFVGDRYQCVRAIHKGLKLRSPFHDHLVIFCSTIGRRRNPPLRFLDRNNPINAFLGRLTWRMGLRG
jgi:hypothetical protein